MTHHRSNFKLLNLCLAIVIAVGGLFVAQSPLIVFAAAQGLATAYQQNFDSLVATGSATWTNDSSLSGWYSSRTSITADNGSSGTGGLYSYGASSSTERGLGSLPKNNTGAIYTGVLLHNDSGGAISQLYVAYTGEQWRNGGGAAQTLQFSYQISASPITSLTAGAWTSVSALNFTSPITGGAATALNGNLAANQRVLSANLTLDLPVNSYFMLRWSNANDQGADHGLAVDDLVVSRNLPPQATADAYTTDEDAPLSVAAAQGVLANDSDPEGQPLTAALVTQAAHGVATLNADGSFSYLPSADYNGPDSFTYAASDGNLPTPATVHLTVVPVNDAPVATGDSYNPQEDQLFSQDAPGVLANDSDIDGDSLTAALVSGTTNGSLTLHADGSFAYQPDADWNGEDSFTYQAHDGMAYSDVVTVSLAVAPVNDAPQGQADEYSVDEDQSLQVPASGVLANDSDPENDALGAVLEAGPAHGSLSLNADGSFSYTPAADWNGTDTFQYRAADGALSSEPVTVTLTVDPVNDAPLATGDAYSTAEDAPLDQAAPGVLGNDVDVDGDALTTELVSGPAHGSLTLNPDGSFVYTSDPDWNGADSFTYTATDGTAESDVATVTLTVDARADAPEASADSYDADEDTLLSIDAPGLLGNDLDADHDGLSALWVSDPVHGTLTLNADGSFTYQPEANWNGDDSFSYQASDGGLRSSIQTVTLHVQPANDAPLAAADTYSTGEDLTLEVVPAASVLANDTDIDGDSLSAVLVSEPEHGTLQLYGNGTFSYTPDSDWNGTDSFSYAASDTVLQSEASWVTLTINPINDAPVAAADLYSLDEDSLLEIAPDSVLANDSDVDGDALTAALVYGPAHGSLTFNADGSFSYTPQADWNGTDSFSYRASDGNAASSPITVTLTVDPVNDAPYLTAALPDQTHPARAFYSFVAAPFFGDIDAGDTLSFSAQLANGDPLPAWLSIDSASGELSGTPANAAAGVYTLRISVTDGLETVYDDFDLTVETNPFQLFIPMVRK